MWTISPWSHNERELTSNASSIRTGRSPIKYEEIWKRERENPELAYNPRFLPNTITFDHKNRPIIRVGVHGVVGKHATVYPAHRRVSDIFLQTLDAAGTWTTLSLSHVLKVWLANQNDLDNLFIRSGTFVSEERVAFDASGDAYTVVHSNFGVFLLHSQDGMASWAVYPLSVDADVYRIELTAAERPPVICAFKGLPHEAEWGWPHEDECLNGAVSVIAPAKKPDGTLHDLHLIDVVSSDATDGPSHSGGAAVTLTLNNKTHVVYTGTQRLANQEGTPQYIVTYDHNSQTATTPVLLGTTLGTPNSTKCGIDGHNGAAIVADSRGLLHVVLGAHQHPFKYTVSKRSNDSTTWEDAVAFGEHETYVGLVIDQADTLHLVSRRVNEDDHLALHYMRKTRDESAWVDIGDLLIPKPTHYSNWYHKLTIDRRGVLFLTYFYYSHGLTEDECAAYKCKWPDECVSCAPGTDECGINGHDPVILLSGDGGDSWQIATTSDLVAPWLRLTARDPTLSDDDGWDDVTNYATIQTAVVNDELYLLARANKGIHTWRFDPGNRAWTRLALNDPTLSDDDGWDDVTNYATIQTAVVNDELYLLARANKGIHTWRFDPGNRAWTRLALNDPTLSDDDGWDDVTNYATIQTAVVNDELYLLARANKGIHTWRFDPGNRAWTRLALNDPTLSDDDGWDDVTNYATIQTAVVNDELYLLARANKGITTWRFDPGNRAWTRLALNDPTLSDDDGWDDVTNYATIQTAVVNDELYLLARANKGIHTWRFDPGNRAWTRLALNDPTLSDDDGWDDVTNYATIQTAVVNDELYLLARADRGIHTWKFDPGGRDWVLLAVNMPVWSDEADWDDVTNYATIQTAVVNDELFLVARSNSGISTWTRGPAFTAN